MQVVGAAGSPDALRKRAGEYEGPATGDMNGAAIGLGSGFAPTPDLEAQQALRDAVSRCLRAGMRTLLLGGGHRVWTRRGGAERVCAGEA